MSAVSEKDSIETSPVPERLESLTATCKVCTEHVKAGISVGKAIKAALAEVGLGAVNVSHSPCDESHSLVSIRFVWLK